MNKPNNTNGARRLSMVDSGIAGERCKRIEDSYEHNESPVHDDFVSPSCVDVRLLGSIPLPRAERPRENGPRCRLRANIFFDTPVCHSEKK